MNGEKSGSVNEFPAIALDNDNLSVTDNKKYPARWNPDTNQWIFFLRSGASNPCPSAVTLTLGWSANNSYGTCTDRAWINPVSEIGWTPGVALGTSINPGSAVISQIIVEWSANGTTNWQTVYTINSATDPDPRLFSYYWFPSASGVYLRARYTANYAAVKPYGRGGVYANLTATEFISPVYQVGVGDSSIPLTAKYTYQTLNAVARPSAMSRCLAKITAVRYTDQSGTLPSDLQTYYNQAINKTIDMTTLVDYADSTSGVVYGTSSNLVICPGIAGSATFALRYDTFLSPSTITKTGCSLSGSVSAAGFIANGSTIWGAASGGVRYRGWVEDPLDQYGYAPAGTLIEPSIESAVSRLPWEAIAVATYPSSSQKNTLPQTKTGSTLFATWNAGGSFVNVWADWEVTWS